MKIAIEAQRIFRKNKHGMDFVALESIRELQKIDKENEYYIIVSPGEDDAVLDVTPNFHIIELKCPTYPLWEQMALPLTINRIKPDLLHCTSNTAPLFCNVPLILTLHDIIFLEKRNAANKSLYQNLGRIYRRFIVPRIIPKCKEIITVSKYESDRITNLLELPDNKVSFVYNGYSSHFRVIADYKSVTSKYISEKRYLFFLGNTDPKKNAERVLVAYSLYLKRSRKQLPLLIADLDYSFVSEIAGKYNIEDILPHIHTPGYIPNSDLPYIYSGAFAFLYPSLRESFGIPLLEAMACGTPVITSNTSALPEIAGDGSIQVNPFNEEEIANMIISLEEDGKLYENQVEYGIRRVSQFSWRRTAEELLKLYKSI